MTQFPSGSDLSRLQSDNVGLGTFKLRISLQVWLDNIHLAEDTGFLIRDPGWVEVGCVVWRKEMPTFPERNITV